MRRMSIWKIVIGILVVIPASAVIVLYTYYQMSPLFSRLRLEISLAEHGVLEETLLVEGIAVREEEVYAVPDVGSLRWLVQDGQKIANQQKLAEFVVSEEDQSLILQQQLITMRLDTIERGGDLSFYSKEALQEIEQRMVYLMTDIRHNIKNEQYELAFQNQQLLSEMADQKKLVSVHQNLPEMSVEELEQQKRHIESQLLHLSNEIKASQAGIIGIGSDGLEKAFSDVTSDEDLPELMELMLRVQDDQASNEMRSGYYRIIREHKWHLYLPLEEDGGEWEAGQRITLREIDRSREIRGRIEQVLSDPRFKKKILLVELSEGLTDWHRRRHYTLEIVLQRQEGLVIPRAAVMVDDQRNESVYRIDVNGYAVKTPVKVLAQKDSVAVLSAGSLTIGSSGTDGAEQQVRTIRQYDEIVANPDRVTDGQRVR